MKHCLVHDIIAKAPQEIVYAVISKTADWPDLLEPCLKVQSLGKGDKWEHIEITALVNEKVMTWESYRVFNKEEYSIVSQIKKTMPMVARMEVLWKVVKTKKDTSRLFLMHQFDMEAEIGEGVEGLDTPNEAYNFIKEGINKNSILELQLLRDVSESMYKSAICA